MWIVSNTHGFVPLWGQQAAKRDPPDDVVVWDYHVFVVAFTEGGWHVFDLDTTLGFPVPLDEYVAATFRPGYPLKERYAQMVKDVPAGHYLSAFGSDRSHMLDADGVPTVPFPPWEPIYGERVAESRENTLPRLRDFSNNDDGILHASVADLCSAYNLPSHPDAIPHAPKGSKSYRLATSSATKGSSPTFSRSKSKSKAKRKSKSKS